MSSQEIDLAKMTVDEVLRRWPQTAQVFRDYALACLGCAIAPFCEISNVATIYNIPVETLIADLKAAIAKSQKGQIG